MNAPLHCKKTLAWHGIICRVPSEWECVRYTNNPEAGDLEFQDRHGLKAVFRWKRMLQEPDPVRLMLVRPFKYLRFAVSVG